MRVFIIALVYSEADIGSLTRKWRKIAAHSRQIGPFRADFGGLCSLRFTVFGAL
jgi:hypothetical protein